jgi:hypothetical protein
MFKATLLVASLLTVVPALAMADTEFYGTIQSKPDNNIGAWVIGDQQIQVNEKTKLEDDHGPLAIGACVEVEHKHGVAKEIESEKTEKCTKPAANP